jgi:DNA modification methylase
MWRLVEADCVEAMRELPADSIDAIVTDPPYGLGFMGKEWDDLPPGLEWAQECIRVLKPGGHLLAFGGSRTYHRLACAVEDAGFEVRDQMMWLYGSGFPKSLNVGKAIDKAAGAEREVVGEINRDFRTQQRFLRTDSDSMFSGGDRFTTLTAPATPEAEKWEGWGTALKPAHEPIVVARKPLAGTVAANVLEFGTGALNIDGCRISADPEELRKNSEPFTKWQRGGSVLEQSGGLHTPGRVAPMPNLSGRWPANVILDKEAGRLLDEQSGERPGGAYPAQRGAGVATGFGEGLPTEGGARQMGDTGGASRFFYCPKASKGERNAGLDGFEEKMPRGLGVGDNAVGKGRGSRSGPRANHHPTVKPIELMRYLCRLVTPPGGTVLDPFTGSGTTGCAAVLEGFEFVGVEREAEYAQIAKVRIAWWEKHQAQGDTDDIMRAAGEREETEQAGQLGLLDEAA